VAKTRLSSATAEIEPLIEAVLSLGLPIVGVISDQQESIGLAVHHQRPTVPQQICQYHDLQEVAPPIGDADRHVKKELNKKIRGMSEIERPAEAAPSQAAQRVADYGLAVRTVMRDEGKYPLEPPGLTWSQQLPLMMASVERVMGAPPSAWLNKLSRRLAVLHLFQQEFEPLVILFSWIHHMAHLLNAETSREQAPSRLLTFVHHLQQSCSQDRLLSLVAYVEKITRALTPHRFEYVTQPLLPRTNNDLELFIGRIKQSRHHITGRQNTQEFILREGSFMAILFGRPETTHGVETFPSVHLNDFPHTLNLLRQPEKRSQCWHVRHDLAAYLASLEPH
jgi:hypothetical protein